MPPRPPAPQPVLPPGERFRAVIEAARAAGTELSDHVLQLTHGDAAKLRRDRSIPDDDICYLDGEMRYLGVRVTEGIADASALTIPPPPTPVEDTPAKEKKMAKGQKKSNKEVRKPKAEKPKPVPAGKSFLTPPEKTR